MMLLANIRPAFLGCHGDVGWRGSLRSADDSPQKDMEAQPQCKLFPSILLSGNVGVPLIELLNSFAWAER